MACVYRDGFVRTDLEKPTIRDHDERSVIPLLTGKEELTKDGKVKYIRIGKLGDVHVSLLSQTGKKIHILRGYELNSSLAPLAGIRYDGLWKITSFSQKLDVNTELYRLELVLEPTVNNWAPAKMVPSPSQFDDWNLYKRLEGEKIRQLKGENSALEWRVKQEVERAAREEAQRVRDFRTSIGSTETAITPTPRLQISSLDYQGDKGFSTSAAAMYSAMSRTP